MLSRQFSGYITVDSERRRNLFYWVVQSERSVQSDPVVLWLTGGPGCSSMDALIYENGPFSFSFKGMTEYDAFTYIWAERSCPNR